MRMILLLSLLCTYILSATMEIYPKNIECELFNNLKHTKNRGHIVLKLDRTYEMYGHHKGQYLVKVEGATPPQRWVDDDCLSLRPVRGTLIYEVMHSTIPKPVVKKFTGTSEQNILALSWHNAFCETHRYKRECKYRLTTQYSAKHFVLHGLWPQPKSRAYCGVDYKFVQADKSGRWWSISDLELDDKVETELSEIMPGYASDLHKHEWVKHGTCHGTEANEYFKKAISLTKQLNESEIGALFADMIGEYLSLKEVRDLVDKRFGKGTGRRVGFQCRHGLVTELWLQLGSGSDDLATLLKQGKPIYTSCKGGRVDAIGYGRQFYKGYR